MSRISRMFLICVIRAIRGYDTSISTSSGAAVSFFRKLEEADREME
jgi:hypothetical protein